MSLKQTISWSIAEEKIFVYALFISLLAHIGVITKLSVNNPKLVKSVNRDMEFSYTSPKVTEKRKDSSSPQKTSSKKIIQETKILEERRVIPNAKAFVGNQPNVGFLIKDMAKVGSSSQINNKEPDRIDVRPVDRRITVSELKSEKINNPVYLTYYQIVRNRIKEKAYLNYSRTQSGEVFLTFVLTNDGVLKQVKLIEEKTSADEYLKTIGLKSIQESTPFPSFPKDLKYPELSFNVVISFEVRN